MHASPAHNAPMNLSFLGRAGMGAILVLLTACGGETSGDGGGGSSGTGGADAGDAGNCPPMQGPMDCVDPCTDEMYGPSCVGGNWTCDRTVPDGGCAEGGTPGPFACGELTCESTQICMHPYGPGACPPPDSGVCVPGCPGCEPLPAPTCESLPPACVATPTCECLLEELCYSSGMCAPESDGLEVICYSA
jgi:hypothetical protein